MAAVAGSLGHITRYECIQNALAWVERLTFCGVGNLYGFLGAARSAVSTLGSFHFAGSFPFGSRSDCSGIFHTRPFGVTCIDVRAVATSSYLHWLALAIWLLDEQTVRSMIIWPFS